MTATRKLTLLQDITPLLTKGQEWVVENCILLHVSGSHLYGMNGPDSDYDYVGVTVPPIEYWVGGEHFEQAIFKDQDGHFEGTIYDVRKFLRLCSDCNPNIVESLFVPNTPTRLLHATEAWGKIVGRREIFLSQKAYHTFGGYLTSQIHKLQTKQDNKTGRQDIMARYGFDTKFAAHAFRLLGQGVELLQTHRITFPRPNSVFLNNIREGRSYSNARDAMIADLIKLRDTELLRASEQTTLPHSSDKVAIRNLQIELFYDTFGLST